MRLKKSVKLLRITHKLTLLLLFVSMGYSLEAQVSGTIVDATNVPMPGVNVVIKGTQTGTVSDVNGKYSIKAKEGDTLVYSFVGYVSQSIGVGTSNTINVTLSEENKALDEVVVIGYGVQKKVLNTGATLDVGRALATAKI